MSLEKIIIVDDDVSVIKNLELIFSEYDIIGFTDAKKALEYFNHPNEASLAIVDVVMPEINGISLLKLIKEKNKDLPVIITTAYSSKEIAIKALRSHADDYVEKPFDVDEFKDKIENILKEREMYNPTFGLKKDHVGRIKHFIERNYKNASLSIIAQEMCLSPKYISRMFNEKSGSGFRDYKLHIKIDKAKELLEKSSFNINEISMQLGYQNPESFMRIFKRITEQTPMQYRKSYKAASKK